MFYPGYDSNVSYDNDEQMQELKIVEYSKIY